MRRRWWLGAAAALLAAVVVVISSAQPGSAPPPTRSPRPTTAPPSTPTQPPPPPAAELGASVNRLFNDQTYTPAQISAQLGVLAASGARIARSDTLWEATEPAPPVGGVHRYDWAFDDAIAGALAGHGLRWLAIVDYAAPWAESIPGHEHSPPAHNADFAAYAAAFATRYGSGGAFWRAHPDLTALPVDTYEIWNEPDNPSFWNPGPSASRYAGLYGAARAAIHAVDPSARVIVGGLTDPRSFLPALVGADPALGGRLDGVAVHPYAADPAAVLAKVRGARAVLRSLGLASVPLYVTEFGWTTSPPGALDYLPERLRPGYVRQTLAALAHSGCGVTATVLYTWVTPERNPAQKEDWFGISPPGGGAGADAAAFAKGLAEAGEKAVGPPSAC